MRRLLLGVLMVLGWASIASAQGDQQAPTQPDPTSIFSAGAHGLDLGWGASTDNVAVTAYRVERCTGASCSNFAEIGQVTPPTVTYADRTLTADTLYRYRVRAQDATPNFSTYTAIFEARTRTETPTLSWTDNSGDETGFIISSRDACGAGSYTDVVTVDAGTTTWTDATTWPANVHQREYRVRATNSSGDSANLTTVCWTKERQVHGTFSGRTPSTAGGSVGVRQR